MIITKTPNKLRKYNTYQPHRQKNLLLKKFEKGLIKRVDPNNNPMSKINA